MGATFSKSLFKPAIMPAFTFDGTYVYADGVYAQPHDVGNLLVEFAFAHVHENFSFLVGEDGFLGEAKVGADDRFPLRVPYPAAFG
jgi:hypothetical protein